MATASSGIKQDIKSENEKRTCFSRLISFFQDCRRRFYAETASPAGAGRYEAPWEINSTLHGKVIDEEMLAKRGYVEIQELSERDKQKVLSAYSAGPVPGYGIAQVSLIYNRVSETAFYAQLQRLHRRHGKPEFNA